ncbi:c2H2-type zinc-finger domain-containing protein [Ditylenchus destructor]|uniref:C2H2-type zinc-finger domain-containing protein n=1 Tax=Ditylenchus destructor TaxID=166010 RepID=A0AAD4MJ22_9BILA|nr:c2H2-type zinc-finger domain-containing protein [Ditylenchus destructor]
MKETDLKVAIEECRRMSTLQLSPADTTVDWHQNSALNRAGVDENVQVTRDSKELLRRVFISLGGTSTDAGNISTEMKQENPESITLSRDKVIEDKLKAVVEECRLPASQSISRDFKNDLHQDCNAPSDQSSFRATVTESGPVSSHVTQEQTNGEMTENAAEDDIEIVFESVPQKVKDEVTTPKDISLGLKNALRRTYDILCDETTVDTSAKEVECFSSEMKQELSNNEATGNITADENDDYNRTMAEMVTVQRESSVNLLEKTLESRIKDLGRDSLTTESNSCANDASIFALSEMQSLHGSPRASSDTQSEIQLNSTSLSNETFNQIDQENIRQDSTANGQRTTIPLTSIEENAFSNEQNADEEFNEHDAIEPAIQTHMRSLSNKSAANLIQRKRTLPMNDRHSRTKLSSKRSNPKITNDTERLHKCDHCTFVSVWKCAVVHHMRTHTGEKPFKCDHCSFACADKSTLDKHVRTHTGEKPYKCDVCPYASAQSGVLKEHMRIHTGEKPFKCSLCSFASAKSSHLNVHMRTHTNEKPYKCSECAYAGSSSSHLYHHIRRHHSKETG